MNQIALINATGRALRKLRHENDITQTRVAKGSNIDYSVYNRLEKGLTHIHLSHIVDIANYFGISPGQMVDKIMDEKNGKEPTLDTGTA